MIIGIGAEKDLLGIEESLKRIKGRADIVIFSREMPKNPSSWIEYKISDNPEEELVNALYSGSIDAAIRGTLPANSTLKALKKRWNTDTLRRIAVLETAGGKKFILAPVGVDEGWSVLEKTEFINASRPLAEKLGISPKVAVLSGGRTGDIGRHEIVDRTINDAEKTAELTGADNCEILIEDAIKDHGIIIAPDGISGNLIFRTLCLLGGGNSHGAPVVNIDKIFVDTSRAGKDYSNAVLLAISLLKK
ncbi:MAG: methanogenesis marker protein Mmp4/MtxX [Methanomicrobiaceae archaeon]|nr:methanogenesis marker protein Mmp4/MtxX [Methanomicrobiaceae archaeon]